MKNAKLMLAIIYMAGIFAGAAAFKINRYSGSYLCTTTTSTLDPMGRPVTCSYRGTTGALGAILGRCVFSPNGDAGTTGSNCTLVTRWGPNQ